MNRRMAILLILAVTVSVLPGCNPDATYTVVYLVRHAEVDYSGGDTNPPLTGVGQDRAVALRDRMNSSNLAAVYQTQKIRTRQTAAPVAADQGLTPTEIPDGQNQQLVDHVLANYSGQTVLIVNHSHNLLDIIDRFGAARPFDPYPSNEFDKLIVVLHSKVDGAGSAGAFASEYGAASP